MKHLSELTDCFSVLNFARAIIVLSLIAAALLLPSANVYGQRRSNLAGIDPTFTPGISAGGNIEKTILQPDGKIVVIGVFNNANGTAIRNVVRLNTDNSLDTSFNVPVGISPRSMELLPDGKFIAFGFSSIFRLNSDGSIDPSFNFARTIAGGNVPTFKPRSDGKVIAHGSFKVTKGRLVIAENFILLDQLGGIESGFRPDITGQIIDVVPLPNGKTAIVGNFVWRHLGQIIGKNLAVLNEDGSPDLSFSGFYGKQGEYTRGVALQPDGKLLIYGTFSEAYKSPPAGKPVRNMGVLRLNADGSFDRDFSVPFVSYSEVFAAFVQPDGKIVLRGTFSLANGSSSYFLARVFSDGGFDQSYAGNLPFAPNLFQSPTKMEMQADGRILMAGDLKILNNPNVQKFIRLNTDGTLDATFQTPPIIGSVFKFDQLPGGNIFIYGTFGKIGAHTRIGVARLNQNGSLDESFRFDFLIDELNWVSTLALQPDGKFIISGRFSVVNGEYVGNAEQALNSPYATSHAVARLNADGSLDNSFVPYTNVFDQINCLTLQPDGKILIGGEVRPQYSQNYVVRLNSDGTPDASFDRPLLGSDIYPNAAVYAIAVQPDGKILIGGDFPRVGSVMQSGIARLNPDGAPDESFDYQGYRTGGDIIDKIIIQPDGKIIAGGGSAALGGTLNPSPGLPRFNRNGTLDANFKWNQIQVRTITRDMRLQPDGKILFSGQIGTQPAEIFHPDSLGLLSQNGEIEFRYNVTASKFLRQADGKIILFNYHGQPSDLYRLTRILPDGSPDNTFLFSLDRQVSALVEQADGKILVAGSFMTVNGIRRNGLVRLIP
jgi:uncharacterized delta-60 repeat protein